MRTTAVQFKDAIVNARRMNAAMLGCQKSQPNIMWKRGKRTEEHAWHPRTMPYVCALDKSIYKVPASVAACVLAHARGDL